MDGLIGISVGEISGDHLGSYLLEILLETNPLDSIVGTGGEQMASLGFVSWTSIEEMNVNGFGAVLRKLPFFWSLLERWKQWIDEERFKRIYLVDFADFNLRLGTYAHQRGVEVFFLAPPQIWLWRRRRIRKIREFELGCLHLFEHQKYVEWGLKSTWVGSPKGKNSFEYTEDLVLGVFPGSRLSFAKKQISFLKESLQQLTKFDSRWKVRWVCASEEIESYLHECEGISAKELVVNKESKVGLHWAWCPPGTVTSELARKKIPFEVFAKVSLFKWCLGKFLLGSTSLALPNLILQESVFRETYFTKFDSNKIFKWVQSALHRREELVWDLERLQKLTGEKEFNRRLRQWMSKDQNG